MASSQQDGDGASSGQQPQQTTNQGNATQAATTGISQATSASAPQAAAAGPTSKTLPLPLPQAKADNSSAASTRPPRQTGLRGAQWSDDEVIFVLERKAEWPDIGWVTLRDLMVAQFPNSNPPRTAESIRQQFRLTWPWYQARLDYQRDNAGEVRALGRILVDAVDEVKTDEGEEGDDADEEGENGADGADDAEGTA